MLDLILICLGSPPLTRGKALSLMRLCKDIGITPAYAGKRVDTVLRTQLQKDHPRLRGEKFLVLESTKFRKGSPPLTRGKVNGAELIENRNRITPAYAGKSAIINGIKSIVKDHPRLRGEK